MIETRTLWMRIKDVVLRRGPWHAPEGNPNCRPPDCVQIYIGTLKAGESREITLPNIEFSYASPSENWEYPEEDQEAT